MQQTMFGIPKIPLIGGITASYEALSWQVVSGNTRIYMYPICQNSLEAVDQSSATSPLHPRLMNYSRIGSDLAESLEDIIQGNISFISKENLKTGIDKLLE